MLKIYLQFLLFLICAPLLSGEPVEAQPYNACHSGRGCSGHGRCNSDNICICDNFHATQPGGAPCAFERSEVSMHISSGLVLDWLFPFSDLGLRNYGNVFARFALPTFLSLFACYSQDQGHEGKAKFFFYGAGLTYLGFWLVELIGDFWQVRTDGYGFYLY